MAAPSVEEGSLVDSLAAALESGTGADVTLVVGGSELPAHGSVLAARSPVFAAALRHDMREARSCRIEIADVREAVLKQLLRFLYTDTAPELDSMAAELLSAADKYDVPLLKKRCEQAMARDLTVENAAATAVLADLHSCPQLKSAAVDFIVGHLEVMATEGWKSALRNNVDVAAEICSLVAEASSKNRAVSKEDNRKLSQCLVVAAGKGNVQEVRRLLAAGAPVDARDGSGYTALHRAVMNGRTEAVKCLVYAGADVNVQNSYQQTPLHYAASYRIDLIIIWLLLGASALVDVKDDRGKTPLHWAVASGNDSIVKALLAARASMNIVDHNANTPVDLAQSLSPDIFKSFY